MPIVETIWSIFAGIAIVLSIACGLVWIIERRNFASLMLCILGIAASASAYTELGMMHSATAAEYGEWVRWYHFPVFLTFVGQLLFVHYYLGTGRLWLMCAIIFARSVVLAVNFSVYPNFNFSNIVSLSHVSMLGEQVSIIGVAVPRTEWQWFAVASLILWIVYVFDAAVRRWMEGGRESRRKALAVGLGMAVPLLCTVIYTQLLVFGIVHDPVSNLPWFVGALITMAYELGRDFIVSTHSRLKLAELQVRLTQTERIGLLGQLASTLAHELTQPLTAIMSNAAAARMHLQKEAPDIEELLEIVDDISSDDRRAADIITRMRQFLQRRTLEVQPLSVEDTVRDVISLVHSEATSKHIELDVLMPPGLPRVFGDRVHLSQVLLNLVMNGIHAVESRPPDARHIFVEARADGVKEEVEIVVRDSGPGIPDSLVDKVFEPFFSTKSEGLGIGLALSRTIIEAHGGHLWSDHVPQQEGAVFRFTLRQA